MECTNCGMHGVAATECMPERIYEQFPRESCSETRSDTHAAAAVPRSSRCALHASAATWWSTHG
eukprot:109664-Lingulodinium_polyedra.AAC.1